MFNRKSHSRSSIKPSLQQSAAVFSFACCLFLQGCSTQQLEDYASQLGTLLQNKELAESTVRDLKSTVDRDSPAFSTLEARYEDLRTTYNEALDDLTVAALDHQSTDDLHRSIAASQVAATHFFEPAARSLNAESQLRDVDLRRAIVFPDHLEKTLRDISSKHLPKTLKQLERQAKWRSWGEIR